MSKYPAERYIGGVYKNHEGKIEYRQIVPLRIELKETEWHGLAWTLTAWCKDRQAERDFDLSQFNFRPIPGIVETQAGPKGMGLKSMPTGEEIARLMDVAFSQRDQAAGNPIIPRNPIPPSLVWVRRHKSTMEDAYDPNEPSPRQGHTVVEGDTLSQIAQKFYDNWHVWPLLVSANKLKNGDDIKVDQTLWIPSRKGKRKAE